MTPIPDRRQPLLWEGVALSGYCTTAPTVWLSRKLVDDSVRKVQTAADIVKWRALAVYYIWGFPGAPNWLPTVQHNVPSPFVTCPNLAQVDLLTYSHGATSTTGLAIAVHLQAWHFIPASGVKNRAVIYCAGHGGFNDDESTYPTQIGTGEWRMITSLVSAGFDVFVYEMPGNFTNPVAGFPQTPSIIEDNWHADTGAIIFPYIGLPHDWLANYTPHYRSIGSFLRFFLTMPTLCLNYAQALGRFSNFNAVGLSGGGWSTVLMSALDTRIARSYSVAGSQPNYMRAGNSTTGSSVGDAEQNWDEFYAGCGYLDLYLMATSGGRHAEHIYNYSDDTCFGYVQYQSIEANRVRCWGFTYEQAIADFTSEISTAAAAVTGGTFVTIIDHTSTSHQNSWATCAHVVSDLG